LGTPLGAGGKTRLFRIGLPEILIIIVVVIVFVNPKQLPGFFRKAGKFVQQMKEMRDSFKRSLEEVKNQIDAAGNTGSSLGEVQSLRPEQPDRPGPGGQPT
jgi:Tat protein translocase TatB subunit